MYHIYPIQAKPSISSLFSYNWVVFHPLPYVTKGPWSFPLLKLAFCTFKMLSNSTTFFISTSKPGGCGGSAAACWVVGEGRNYTPNKPWWFNKKQGKVSEIEPWNVLSDILFRIFFWLLEVLLFVFGRFCVWSFSETMKWTTSIFWPKRLLQISHSWGEYSLDFAMIEDLFSHSSVQKY